MADLRIVDAPEIPTENITGEEKLPTGGNGNYSISLDSLADYTKNKKDLVDNASVDGKVNGVRQELDAHIEDLLNPHQVTKGQIGLGNVDNTADADKPVSNSAQAAIISAVSPKADKTYVDNALSSKSDKTYVDAQLLLKANKADVYTKSETYTKQESNDLVNNSISTALTPVNTSLDLAKRGIANRYDSSLTYNSGERVVLINGDIVKSTINGNANNPNTDMTGWVKTNLASQVFDESGLNQQQWNDGIESIAELIAISTPKNGSRVYVKSYYAGLNSGGGDFIFKAGTAETEVQGFVINVAGGVWKRVLKNVHSIEDAGAHPTKTAIENANAINAILGFVKVVQVPTADYSVEPSIIKMNSGNVLFGNGRLIGTAPNTAGIADGSGEYLLLDGIDNVIIKDVQLINGYKSVGIMSLGSKNLVLDNVTVDGCSYGMWIAEKDHTTANSQGSQNILINNPKILNTRYWGIYARAYNITDDAKKTQNIKCINPYFYNCNMAAFVCAEGNVKYVTLESPVFNRCNVCMHFEFTSDYTVNNARDYDTGKKADHVPSNSEYPFVNWSIYHCFSRNAKINNCTLEKTAYHLANEGISKVKSIHYSNTTAFTYVFEGVGSPDTNKDYFSDVTWDGCTSISEFIYQQPTDAPLSYLRDFRVTDSTCLLDGAGNGTAVGISIVRGVNFTLDDTTFVNSCLRLKLGGFVTITNNKWTKGTDNTQSIIESTGVGLSDANFLITTNNIFARAGGVVFGDAAIHFKNWVSARADNIVRGNNIGYAYRFTDCYRVDIGAGLLYDTTVGDFVETGATSLIRLFNVP